ncbi:hypothetical protein M3N64_05090 [Sporolactobacillus sp. CPB3-1]|uniref:Uncharacterized protein n=1 Tax=Sporolactobacillus mangiferae TaxID=2940498 RepID=A0ABT0M8W5_9BACL|nr:hypothetical protein [Sporolactobacillus mangiferae]MCL1631325.1 hypothetical protein [Sporolactobacillus mangiferae]
MSYFIYAVFSMVILFQILGLIDFYQGKFTSETVKFITDAALGELETSAMPPEILKKLRLYVTVQCAVTVLLSLCFIIGSTDFRIALVVLFILSRFGFRIGINRFLKTVGE